MIGLYGALFRLAWAAILPYQFVTGLFGGRHRARLRERLGLLPEALRPAPGGLWVHAVSVGEVRLAMSVIAAHRRRAGADHVHLTATTETGRALALEARARGAPGAPDGVSAFPADLPGPMRRLLEHLRPRAVVVMETEIWPHLYRQARRRRLPLVILNARLSPRAFPRYRRFRALFGPALAGVSLVAARSAADAERFVALGAAADRVRVTGDLKFDLPAPVAAPAEVRRRLGLVAAPVLVAGSTARAETGPVLDAFTALRAAMPGASLVLAPRHPEDLDDAAAAVTAAGWRLARYGALAAGPAAGGATHDVVLVDHVGVLPEIYAAADLAFVGGSLVPRGGQNLLEPAAVGVPVLFGPQHQNVRAAADALLAAGGGFVARDGAHLATLVVDLARDPSRARAAGAAARGVVERERGGLQRTLDAAEPILGPPPAAA
jgi:3-deoxy-D-manno-octulosonic-acid transferase